MKRPLPQGWTLIPRETRDRVLQALIERRRRLRESQTMDLVKADAAKPLPASLEQTFFLRQQQRFDGELAWTIAAQPIILDDVDPERVKAAISALARRHDVLHTLFARDGDNYVLKRDPARPPPFSIRKLPFTVALTGAENWVRKRYEQMLEEPFDAEKGPLWRAELCTFAGRGVVLLTFCSAIIDGDSLYMIDHDLRSLLADPSGQQLTPVVHDYADYAASQALMLAEGKFDAALGWWQERLAGGPPESWNDGREPIGPAALYEQVIGTRTAGAIDSYAAGRGTTPPVVFLTILMECLAALDAQQNLWVAAATAGRSVAGTETMVGTFARLVLLRFAWPEEGDALEGVHALLAESMDQPPVPHLLVKDAIEAAHPDRPSAFRYVFNYRHVPSSADSPAGEVDIAFRVAKIQPTGAREEDILFMVMQSESERLIHWYLREDRFSSDEAERLLSAFKTALDRRLSSG